MEKTIQKMKLWRWIRRWRPSGWNGWPDAAYQLEHYRQRLWVVQEHLAERLSDAPLGPLGIISMCAGDGRDVIEVLRWHERRKNVAAKLVEANRRSVANGIRRAAKAGLTENVRFLCDDATDFATYRNIAPTNIILACGVWGHVPAEDRASLVGGMAALCKAGGVVIWTRGTSKGKHRFDQIQSHFAAPIWKQVRVSFTPDTRWGVATFRYCGPRIELPQSGRLFNFQRLAG